MRIEQCHTAIASHPVGDPRRIAAEARLKELSGWQYHAGSALNRGLRSLGRRLWHLVFVALLQVLKLVLIVVFNLAALWLFLWLLGNFY